MHSNRRSSKKNRAARRGLVTVEMALTLPLFFLLLFAAIEFARVNTVLHTLDNATYEGTRRAILPGATAEQAESVAQVVLDAVGVMNATISVIPPILTGDESEVTVEISAPLNANAWISPTFFKDATLTRSCTFSTERVVRTTE